MRERQFKDPTTDYVTQSLETLEREVGAIHDSETFRRYLDAQARFHRYSFNNVLLILSQYPDASQVAGFNTWKSLERNVRKGEKAIRILAPLKKKEEDPDTREERYRVFGYRTVPVFALEQTEGKELPKILVPELTRDEGADLYQGLEGIAAAEGLRVQRGHERFQHRPHLYGFYERDQRLIAIRGGVAQLQATKTLAHEVGHHIAGHTESGPSSETEAESVSYVVLKHHGLDSGERSFPYVASWAQDKNVLRAAMGNIQRVSRTIIDRLHPSDKELPIA